MEYEQWILCPICKNKTRTKLREDTELVNFPLFCPKCKHERIKQYGQALLDIPCCKLLMGMDGPNLKETAKLYDLTEAEQELLLARKRGLALYANATIIS